MQPGGGIFLLYRQTVKGKGFLWRKKRRSSSGAGPAGLTAAYELLKKSENVRPVILEAENFVGGISRTAEYKGNRMDIGGHRFFSKDDRVTALWTSLLPVQGSPAKDDLILDREKPLVPGGPDPEKTDEAMLVRDRVSRIVYLRKFFDYPISMKPQTFINMGLGRTLKAGFGYLGSCLHKREETNLENFYINRFGKPLYSMFFEDYTEKLWGVHPSKIAADWGAQRVKGLSVSKAIKNALSGLFGRKKGEVETSLIEQFLYPKKGPRAALRKNGGGDRRHGRRNLPEYLREKGERRRRKGAVRRRFGRGRPGTGVRRGLFHLVHARQGPGGGDRAGAYARGRIPRRRRASLSGFYHGGATARRAESKK